MKKKILLSFIVFVFSFALVSVIKIKAGVGDNTTGWLWGGGTETDGSLPGDGTNTNVGWISMNSLNCDADGNGLSDQNNGINPNCPVNGTAVVDYGVTIPDSDGDLSGYAWSENIGAIAFDNSDGYLNNCPAGNGACSARRVGNEIKGWARFVGIAEAASVGNSGDWEGWIKLNGSGWGLDITKMDGTGINPTYAYSDELGWIDFSKSRIVTLGINLVAAPNSCVSDTCLPFSSTLTASKSTGSATGDITYKFDCEDDGTYEGTYTTVNVSQNHVCSYPTNGIRTAKVEMTQEGVVKTASVLISISPTVCGDSITSDAETCDDGNAVDGDGCDSSCQIEVAGEGNWVEVNP